MAMAPYVCFILCEWSLLLGQQKLCRCQQLEWSILRQGSSILVVWWQFTRWGTVAMRGVAIARKLVNWCYVRKMSDVRVFESDAVISDQLNRRFLQQCARTGTSVSTTASTAYSYITLHLHHCIFSFVLQSCSSVVETAVSSSKNEHA